ncbi:MAG: dihydrolipoamide acetyltransferase family protein [Thermodesulfobacteriota bacterium]|nr:dihydrolipoamide acetyltransferase family protein [Thermodesulfobacteriota bacterium]
MAVEVQMPGLGLSIAEGTIERWLKKEGDPVEKGDLLVAIITEKITVEIPAEASGTLLKIFSPAGTKVMVGQTIALIGLVGERVGGFFAAEEPQYGPPHEPQEPFVARKERGDLKVSPLALKIAEEQGLDIREIAAKYPGKKIGKKEIFDFLEERKGKPAAKEVMPSPVSTDEEVKPLSGPLRAMAEHMGMSARTAARVTTIAEVDMTELVKLRNALKEKLQQEFKVNLTFVPFVMRAMAEGVKEFPILNASLQGEGVVFHRTINVGVAVDTGETLLVPVVKDVAHKSILELSREVIQISDRARERKLSLQDIQGGTITLTNAGVYGALLATPIIHQPQSAILWMGKVMETPVVREGQIVIRSMMYLCLSYDHRIIMGAQAVRFLQVVKKNLENPYPLLF